MDITEEEKEKLNKLLMNAYNLLCKAEKLLKEGEKSGKEASRRETNKV